MNHILKTYFIFLHTLIYLIRSFLPKANLIQLKQDWACQILRDFNFELNVKNKCAVNSQQILVGNHISFLDIVVLMAVHPQVVFLSKKEVSRWPVIGSAARRIGTIFVDRSCVQSRSQVKTNIKNIFLNKFRIIHLAGFPSGTTTLTEDKPWKKGLFEIAQQCDVKIQPFRISYSPLRECAYIDDDNLLESLKLLFRTQNKKINFEWGTPFEVTDLDQQLNAVRTWATPPESPNEKKVLGRPTHSFQLQ